MTHIPPEGYFLHAVDPGGDTGMSLFHVQPDRWQLLAHATVRWHPRGGENPVDVLVEWLETHPGVHRLLYEDFHVRNTVGAASTDTTALLVLGAIEKMMLDRRPYEAVFKQEPVEGKKLATDEVLERLGLHMGHAHAQRHVRDANRHAVTHLARQRYLPVCRVAFPRRSEAIRSRRPAESRPGR